MIIFWVCMTIATPRIVKQQEFERLKSLIPSELKDAIDLNISTEAKGQSILTHRSKDRRCQIQIDLRIWQSLDLDLRNLLFWHEVARVQTAAIESNRSAYITIAAGLGIAAIDLLAQNSSIGLLVASLLIAGLAGFRLYQQTIGEQSLQRLTTADQAAIDLAVRFGYDRSTACELLVLAIQTNRSHTPRKFGRKQFATRLQVLSLQ
jgi:Protein of unknown function (DUF3318)